MCHSVDCQSQPMSMPLLPCSMRWGWAQASWSRTTARPPSTSILGLHCSMVQLICQYPAFITRHPPNQCTACCCCLGQPCAPNNRGPAPQTPHGAMGVSDKPARCSRNLQMIMWQHTLATDPSDQTYGLHFRSMHADFSMCSKIKRKTSMDQHSLGLWLNEAHHDDYRISSTYR